MERPIYRKLPTSWRRLANIPLDLDFILYKHGPFSFDLRDEITAMRADELMEISLQPNPYGPSLLTTENGHRLQERWSDTLSRYADTITFVAEHIGDLAVAELERLATALYVRKTNPQESVQLSARRLNELKPHVSMQEAQAAVKEVDRMIKEYEKVDW